MSTRRDDLVAALTNVEENGGELATDFVPPSAAEEVPQEAAEAQPTERVRDEQGRFAAKTEPAAPNPAAVAGTPEVQVEHPGVPKSWKQDMRTRWDSMDLETARYVAQREEEMSRGIEQFRQQNEPALAMFGQLTPFIQQAQQQGYTPQQIAQDAQQLYATRANLYHADPNVRMQTLVQVAHSIGIPLQQMLQGQVTPEQQQAFNPQVMALQQRLQALEGNLSQRAAQEQQQSQAQIEAEVSAFAGKKDDAGQPQFPHFESLRESMGQLIQAGMAHDLESAYSKALRMNDDLWNQEQARQRQASEVEARQKADKAAKAARSNAVSTRSATPGATAAPTGVAPKGRRAALSEAFESMQSGRI